MTIIKVGVFMSMLLITPMLVAQNTTVSLWEENLEQLSMDGEERNWEDELEELSRRLQEPININVATISYPLRAYKGTSIRVSISCLPYFNIFFKEG